jgi:MFS family permease
MWMFVKFGEDENESLSNKSVNDIPISNIIHAFKPNYWYALIVISTLYFARFDSSFITLRAKNVMDKNYIPILFLVSSFIQVVTTVPFSKFSSVSKENRNLILIIGFIFMILSDITFTSPLTASPFGMFLAMIFLGFHMAMTHSMTQSMIASFMPVGNLAGTAVSFTDLILGFVLATSNFVAGYLSDLIPNGCFIGGSVATTISLVLLIIFSSNGYLDN